MHRKGKQGFWERENDGREYDMKKWTRDMKEGSERKRTKIARSRRPSPSQKVETTGMIHATALLPAVS
jgi:hypothetical protein